MFNRKKFFNYLLELALKGKPLKQGLVYSLLFDMHKAGLLFHLDDDPSDIIDSKTGEKLFTDREAGVLRLFVPLLFSSLLPDYDEDPHCICVEITTYEMNGWETRLQQLKHPTDGCGEPCSLPIHTPTLPRWGFSFEDEAEEGEITAFTLPQRWNGWGVPMVDEATFLKLCPDVQFDHENFTAKVPIPEYEGEFYDFYREPVLDVDANLHWVYSLAPLGWTFTVEECKEKDPTLWEGYL